jgi:hypothetical protein
MTDNGWRLGSPGLLAWAWESVEIQTTDQSGAGDPEQLGSPTLVARTELERLLDAPSFKELLLREWRPVQAPCLSSGRRTVGRQRDDL